MIHAENKNPATVAAVGGAKVSTDLSGRNLTPAAGKRKLPPGVTEHWLHVARDGTEHTFPTEPDDLPTLHVWSATGREYTATFSTVWLEDCPGWAFHGRRTVTPVWPPGQRWKQYGTSRLLSFIKEQLSSSRPSTVWTRKAVPS